MVPRDSKMNSSNEIVDEWVDIWGTVKEKRWREGRGTQHAVWAQLMFTELQIVWLFAVFVVLVELF